MVDTPPKVETTATVLNAADIANVPIATEMYGNLASGIGDLTDKIKEGGNALNDYVANLSRSGPQFAVMSAFILGAKESFRSLDESIEPHRINNYTDQFKQLVDTFHGSPAAMLASKEGMAAFHSIMGSAGVSAGGTAAAIAGLKNGVMDTANALLVGADNMRHLETAMIMTSASGGTMSEFLKAAGADLENLSAMTLKVAETQNAAKGATGMSDKAMEEYMNTIKDLPGGLQHMSDTMQVAGGSTTVLTAAIQYADGAGRKHADVLKDMKDGMLGYGMSMPQALEYSARISEASEALGARLEDVSGAVKQTSEAFKFQVFGGVDVDKMTQGMTKSMEAYVAQLKEAHIPTQTAIELAKDYTAQTAKMSDGQKAFLSQQSGGPGGLMGAAQMELLQKNNPEEFQKKYMDSIKKEMGGKIVTLEDASKSEAAAAQYQKEKQLISAGPLKLTDDPTKAAAIIEGMSKGKLEAPGGGRGLDETVKAGQKIEQPGITPVQQMNVHAEAVQIQGYNAAHELIQNTMTAASRSRGGVDGTGAGVATENQARLQAGQTASTGQLPGHAPDPVTNLINTFKDVPDTVANMLKAAKESAGGGNQATPEQEKNAQIVAMKHLEETSKNKKEVDAAGQVIQALNSQQKQPQDVGSNIKLAPQHDAAWYNAESVNAASQVGKTINAGTGPTTAGGHVGQAIPAPTQPPATTGGTAATATAAHAAGGMGGGQTGPVPVTLVGSTLTVNFTGKCPHCGSQVHTSEHATVNNAASTR